MAFNVRMSKLVDGNGVMIKFMFFSYDLKHDFFSMTSPVQAFAMLFSKHVFCRYIQKFTFVFFCVPLVIFV